MCRAYSIHHVPKSNLMLLAVDALCYCTGAPISAGPIEVSHILYVLCELLHVHTLVILETEGVHTVRGGGVVWAWCGGRASSCMAALTRGY